MVMMPGQLRAQAEFKTSINLFNSLCAMASDHAEDFLCLLPAPFLPQILALLFALASASPVFIINVVVSYKKMKYNWNTMYI